MVFLIIACVLLGINVLFIAAALLHTLLRKEVEDPRLSVAQMMMDRQQPGYRTSLPQVAIFNAVVRLSVSSNRSSAKDGEMNCTEIAADEREIKPVTS